MWIYKAIVDIFHNIYRYKRSQFIHDSNGSWNFSSFQLSEESIITPKYLMDSFSLIAFFIDFYDNVVFRWLINTFAADDEISRHTRFCVRGRVFCQPFANSGWRDISSWQLWCSGRNSFLRFFKVWKASLWSIFTYLFTLALCHTFYYKVPYKRIALRLWRDNSSAPLTEVKKKILLPVADDEISRHNKINSLMKSLDRTFENMFIYLKTTIFIICMFTTKILVCA